MGPIQSSVSLAQSSIQRLDAIIDEVASVKRVMIVDVAALERRLAVSANIAELNNHKDMSIKNAWAIQAAGRAARKNMLDRMATAKEKAKKTQVRANAKIVGKIAEMEKEIKTQMAEVIDRIPFRLSDEHIMQVVGFKPAETEKYWDGKVYKSKSSTGEVAGRLFYSIKFNVVRPGYWTSGSDELFMACHALSVHLYRQDGIERDLRPPCNHYNHHTWGGVGNCIFIMNSYFSHCGGSSSGYWRMEEACGGVPEQTIRNSVNFEDARHNNDRHYVHKGPNSHEWRDPYQSSAYASTLCTGGNQNYRK